MDLLKALIELITQFFKDKEIVEKPRPNSPPPETKEPDVAEPRIVRVSGVKYKSPGKFKTKSGKARGIVVHYTVSGRTSSSARGVVKYLAGKGLGCPVMDQEGVIYVPEKFNFLTDVAYHAGSSAWRGVSGISNYCIGMEICGWGSAGKEKGASDLRTVARKDNMFPGTYQKFTQAQEDALINFILWLKKNSPDFDAEWIVGHDEIATPLGRKSDPGGSLSMTMPELRKLIKEKLKAI